MSAEKHLLSKTSFLKAVQCQKAFFLYKNHYNLKDPLSQEKQSVFNRGHKVGNLAQGLFANGIDVSPTSVFKYSDSVVRTKELIDNGQEVIYEAAFVFDSTLVAMDILVKRDGKWFAYEVKSSLKISQAYVMDASLQYYVIKNCLPELEDIALVTLNGEYVLGDGLDLHQLFKITSVKKDAEKNIDFIKHHILEAKKTHTANRLPDVKIGGHCFSPYECDFMGTCWKHMPKNNVFELGAISKKQSQAWFDAGITLINDIPVTELNDHTGRMVQSFIDNREIIEKEKLQSFFKKITYPLAFLDMEFYTPAIPKYKGSKPFDLNPFLFSWQMLNKEPGEVKEDFFFHEEATRPEILFIESLIAHAQKVKSILVYDTGQENTVLNKIAKEYPQYKKQAEEIKKKFIDLADVFTNLWYYHPQQKCSLSLKKIYQSILGKDAYGGLPVNSGMLASYGYDNYLNETDVFKKQEIKENLIAYCNTDTKVLHELFTFLKQKLQ
ncbi:MAG TPA: DUF2779 domain-containing protein [Bacteroidia bacterium]|nr:DUF2779 domain-containing protein [Bacteroidia bacterium]